MFLFKRDKKINKQTSKKRLMRNIQLNMIDDPVSDSYR